MKLLLKSTAFALLLSSSFALTAQTTTAKKHKEKKPTVEQQIQALHNDMQAQIDALKSQLAAKDAQVVALQQSTQATTAAETTTAAKVDNLSTTTAQTSSSLTAVQTTATQAQVQSAVTAEQVKTVDVTVKKLEKDVNEPASIHYKGITLTPGGFIAAESVWRQRAMESDIYTPYNFTPYMNSGQAHLSEWIPTARQSRLSLKGAGKLPFGTVTGYVEGDFLSAGVTSNNIQTNSYTFRVRQAWGQLAWGNFKFTGGQMWSLATENKTAADPGTEAVPINIDNNFNVGFTWTRQTAFRIEDSFSKKFTLAMSLENSQFQFAASNAPTNFFFGGAGLPQGLNNSTANYSNQVAPDVILKASFDPGFGHYEIGGMARFFRDRYYPGGLSANAQNDTRVGGGLIASARFPVKTLDIGIHGVAGDGTGRYGSSLLPDVTVRPDGTLALIRNFQGLLTLEEHATKKLDFYGYAGDEYAQRTIHASSLGVQVGYAPSNGNNTGCNVEVPPTAGTGFAPGVSATCLGATRNLIEGTAGFNYRLYSGPAGKLQMGAAYSYLTREAWHGVGPTPKGTNNMVFTSFRYYLP